MFATAVSITPPTSEALRLISYDFPRLVGLEGSGEKEGDSNV